MTELCFARIRPDGRFNVSYHYDDGTFVASGTPVLTREQIEEMGWVFPEEPVPGVSIQLLRRPNNCADAGSDSPTPDVDKV